ncbi:MAG: glycoside hydrolase family 2 TIM barrel-domain containing protein [bacterium]
MIPISSGIASLRMIYSFLPACLIVLLQMNSLSAQTLQDAEKRQLVKISHQWSYLEENIASVDQLSLSRQQWISVDLPHTWNRFDVVDQEPGYRRSIGWYKKELSVPELKADLRLMLYFECVNIKSEIYVNGELAGSHIGGYVGFDVDITPFVKQGNINTILVKADNSYDPNVIPSQKSDFHIYGGITRDVWLKVVASRFIDHVKIATPTVGKQKAETAIEAALTNKSGREQTVELDVVLRDRKGREVTQTSRKVTLGVGTSNHAFTLPSIKNPNLWSPSDPALYTLSITVNENAKPVDQVEERVGYRWFEFKDNGPFYLNGERLLLRGTHRHEDFAGYGMAMPDSLHWTDMKMIKEMGANFVRLAHYPQDPEVYKACDELGILVWDELPWCRGGKGGSKWEEHTKRLLREQIVQNFNHPSIIIWSLGNEFYWLPDTAGGDGVGALRSMIKQLNTIAHDLDPYRVTATRKFTEGADLVDLVSPSMWPGWYSGVYTTFEKAIADAKKNFKKFFHAEYGGDSHVGRHSEHPINGEGMAIADGWEENIKPQKVKNIALTGDWSENYIVDLFDWYLRVSEQTPWFTGNAQWAFKDFPTPLRPENPIPYINEKGLVDRAGVPKDAYFVFKSYWTTSPLFCYIESHTWTERSGPANTPRMVNVYSNCDEVELFLNGVSQGKKNKEIKSYPASGLSWNVTFGAGKNDLRAVGYHNGKQAAEDSFTLSYTTQRSTEPDCIELTSKQLPNGNILVTATTVDKNGLRCLDYNKRIYFSSDGTGELYRNYGTPTRSTVIEMSNGCASIEFKPVPGGKAVIEARNQDFKGAYLVITE